MSDALKPCPFCGGRADLLQDDDGRWTQVMCGSCCGKAPERMQSKEAACAAWNRRSPPSDHAARIAAAEEAGWRAGVEAARAAVNAEALPQELNDADVTYNDAISDANNAIVALPAPTTGALARLIAEAKADGMERGAELVSGISSVTPWTPNAMREAARVTLAHHAAAIRARKDSTT